MSNQKNLLLSPQTRSYNTNYSTGASSSSLNERDRAVSPTRAKISQLNERLSNMQLQVDEEKILKKENFEGKLKILDDKITKTSQSDDTKFKLLKEQLIKLQETTQQEKILRDSQDEKARTKDIKTLENQLVRELGSEKQGRKDYETRVLKQTDERVYQFRLELARNKKAREETEEHNAQDLGDNILGIQDDVEEQRRSREESNQQMIGRLGESIQRLQEILTSEKKQRENAQSQMFRMLEEMNQFLTQELQAEKQDRESTEETLINLLDQTCNKVESQLRR